MVKCADCGFLAARNRETNNLDEVKQGYRNTGKTPVIGFTNNAIGYFAQDAPQCFVRAVNLDREFQMQGGTPENAILAVINKDRDCNKWVEWQPESSPKEHRETIERDRTLERQERKEKDDRVWMAQQQTRLAVVAGLFLIIGAVLGAVIARL